MNTDLLGYAAGFLVAISLFPQIFKSWKTRSAKDISYLWTLLQLAGMLLWIIYGIILFSKPIVIFTSIETILITSLIFLKFSLEKK